MKAWFVFAAAVALAACSPSSSPPTESIMPSQQFEKIDVAVGTGDEIVAGKTAVVHYTGWLFDPGAPEKKGTKFDSSRDRGDPFRFPLGGGRVIKGWDQGVVGMKIGGRRKITIPPMLAYGKRGAGGVIGPDETLVFVVDLIGVR